MRMSGPGQLSSFINFNGGFGVLIPRLIVGKRVKLLGAISGGNQMENCVVSSISEIDCIPGLIVQNDLPALKINKRSLPNRPCRRKGPWLLCRKAQQKAFLPIWPN